MLLLYFIIIIPKLYKNIILKKSLLFFHKIDNLCVTTHINSILIVYLLLRN